MHITLDSKEKETKADKDYAGQIKNKDIYVASLGMPLRGLIDFTYM